MTQLSLPRAVLFRLLVVFYAAVTVPYGAMWMYQYQVQTASGDLGLTSQYSDSEHALVVSAVDKGSAAAQAGLEAGDRLVEVNGDPLDTRARYNTYERTGVEDGVDLTVRRGDALPFHVTAHPQGIMGFSVRGAVQRSLFKILTLYPVVFLGISLTVLALRPADRDAWLMAGLFASFISIPEFPRDFGGLSPPFAAFARAYRAAALGGFPVFFYGFFAVFPVRSPLDRLVPWLKWAILAGWIIFTGPNLGIGGPDVSPAWLRQWVGESAADALRLAYLFAGTPFGVLSLMWNAVSAQSVDARRKARVLITGTVVGVGPVFIEPLARTLGGWQVTPWLYALTVFVSFVFPLSFAYAVVRHRVLDLPVLLRRSARYLLVRRGSLVLIGILGTTATAVFAASFSRMFHVDVNVAIAVGAGFGFMLALGSSELIRRASTRIDRAFFRSAYDATAILEGLAERIPGVSSPQALASLLEQEISEALHPKAMVVYLADSDGLLQARATTWSVPPPAVPVDRPWLRDFSKRGRPWDVSASSQEAPPRFLAEAGAECLVPIQGKARTLLGLIVLGPRVSEETYSSDDKRLLQSVANQAGIALENIQLAVEIAERLDAERQAARELDIARQVQSRLFPQRQPSLKTLDYAGGCVQARRVGGDYYDFVELGPGRVGLVIADISGKGIAGALLMANLQANLRGQYAMAADDLPRLLASVNQLFYESTADNQYATLFFADYSDDTRRLRYANCGHFPPYLRHADGTWEELGPTAMVLGMFPKWSTTICERELKPGDTLVMYTDGVIDAMNAREEEFGTEHLFPIVDAHPELPASALVGAVQDAVQRFTHGPLIDDVTVVVGRVR
jgi:sigma-B regulation protein RsbU (phosphoserine phosphatase)